MSNVRRLGSIMCIFETYLYSEILSSFLLVQRQNLLISQELVFNITMSDDETQHSFSFTFGEKLRLFGFLFSEQILAKTVLKKTIQNKRGQFFKRLHEKFANLPDGEIKAIESRTDLSPVEFKNIFFKNSKPVVFKGAAKNWPCCQKWDLEYFKKSLGQKDVLLVDVDGLSTQKGENKYEILSVDELVSNITDGGDKYLRFSPLVEKNPELSGDLNLNWLNSLKSRWSIGNTYYLFMGGKNTITHLHSDQPCNLFVQVYGKKKWTLISVDQTFFVYPQATQTAYFKSSADLGNCDSVHYPLLKKATRWEAILEPGDVLYVPPHVWHYVENLTDTIGVGFRFSSLRAAMQSSSMFTFLRFCAQNPPMWKTRKYGRVDTNLIWADANGNVSEVLQNIKDRQVKSEKENSK